jgi:hypothetical protein
MSTGKRKRTPLTTTIVASKWARGGRHGNAKGICATSLLNDDGTMCCLGFDAVQRGLCPEANREDCPSDLYEQDRAYAEAWQAKDATDDDISLESLAVDINDDPEISDNERIKQLRPIFAAVNPPRRIVWLKNK